MNTKRLLSVTGVAIASIAGTLLVNQAIFAPGWAMARTKNNLDIQYQVNSGETELEITAPLSNNCTNNSGKKGCFKIKKNKTGLIKFTFTADDEWYLTQFTVCKGNTKITDACGANLNLDERLEFFVMDDAAGSNIFVTPASGQVDLTQLGADARVFYLLDQNTIKQEYFYNIQACKSPSECLTFDPPVENKGLK
jgi:hypothetical protein